MLRAISWATKDSPGTIAFLGSVQSRQTHRNQKQNGSYQEVGEEGMGVG